MRSKPLNANDKIRILGFGDSVINGGVMTGQDFLATGLIEKELADDYGEGYRCLNISYGSWGPDNCYAYLQEYGDFDAKLIFLVVSSHDAYDNMDFQKMVDVHPSYPSSQYKLALWELIERYLFPRVLNEKKEQDHIVKGEIFNSGFLSFYTYTQEKGIPFFIYLHPDKKEFLSGKYTPEGNAIVDFCKSNSIPLLEGMKYETESGFRDMIHMNEQGQKKLAATLLPEIKNLLNLNKIKKSLVKQPVLHMQCSPAVPG
jgi:hypothetical protein